jgi:hypothetical protein
MYGSITQTGMQRVLDVMKAQCGLDRNSHFIDIGAGLGRPLLHAQVSCKVESAWGYEFDRIKCDKALAFGPRVFQALESKGVAACVAMKPPVIHCLAVEKVRRTFP